MLNNQLRIIAGQWRGRKLKFPNVQGLRPTSDRLRETLFNWIAVDCDDAVCLDAFAGSGALGFEALSRSAKLVTMLDSSNEVIQQLQANKQLLKAEHLNIYQRDAVTYLKSTDQQYDLIFLDPPFSSGNLLSDCLAVIAERGLLADSGFIYVETAANATIDSSAFHIKKEKKQGQVMAKLLAG